MGVEKVSIFFKGLGTKSLTMLPWVDGQHKLGLTLFCFSSFFFFCGKEVTRAEQGNRPGRPGKWVWSGFMMWNSQSIKILCLKKTSSHTEDTARRPRMQRQVTRNLLYRNTKEWGGTEAQDRGQVRSLDPLLPSSLLKKQACIRNTGSDRLCLTLWWESSFLNEFALCRSATGDCYPTHALDTVVFRWWDSQQLPNLSLIRVQAE